MAGENTAIFRVTTTGQNEGNLDANELLLFNPTDLATANGYVFASEVFYRNSIPENPKVAGQINEVQDMGIDGIDGQLTTRIQNSSLTTASSKMGILKKWLIEDKTNPVFKKGRFGLRMDDNPIFNVTPDDSPLTFGYVLANIRFIRPQDLKNMVDAIITLRFSGDVLGLGT